jgi:hypothetical protein
MEQHEFGTLSRTAIQSLFLGSSPKNERFFFIPLNHKSKEIIFLPTINRIELFMKSFNFLLAIERRFPPLAVAVLVMPIVFLFVFVLMFDLRCVTAFV